VLVVVLVTIVFATTALILFIHRASTDLMVEAREADARRLQLEAYSALETTLAVLEDFRIAGEGLRSPAEGWDDPLAWIGYVPSEGRRVEVTFVDESGKLSLPRSDATTLGQLFESWGMLRVDAERLADALMGWMQADYTPRTTMAPRLQDYENAPLPFRPPERPLRSFAELRAIDYVREVFFDEAGLPTDLGRQFMEAVSLFDYEQPNINAAPGAVLAALGRYDVNQQRLLEDFRQGAGAYTRGQRYFRSRSDIAAVLGEQGVAAGFGTEIRALRIQLTVRDGISSYRLETVVAPPGGARLVAAPAIPEPRREGQGTPAPAGGSGGRGGPGGRAQAGEGQASLQYPFTILEIRENAAIPSSPVPAPAEATARRF
jgi:type II secretory pathway component PulK